MKEHEVYVSGDYAVLIISKTQHGYIISIGKHCGIFAQMNFVPVQKSVLEEFVDKAEFSSTAVPADISDTMEGFKRSNGGYFTISIPEIWNMNVQLHQASGKSPNDFLQDGQLVFPPVYPMRKVDLIPDGGEYIEINHIIGYTHDVSNN